MGTLREKDCFPGSSYPTEEVFTCQCKGKIVGAIKDSPISPEEILKKNLAREQRSQDRER